MSYLDDIVEQRITEAAARGDFDDLPGAGRPLAPEPDDPFVAPELRMAYRILKNAGYIPEEVRLRREIGHVEELMRTAYGAEERSDAARRLRVLLARLEQTRGGSLQLQQAYYDQLLARLAANDEAEPAD